MPDFPRHWTLWACAEGCDYARMEKSTARHQTTDPAKPRGALVSHELQPVQMVEESRLREVEAERESLRLERDAVEHNRLKDNEHLLARVERLEADLQEAREALAFYSLPENHHSDRVAKDLGERARGVLRKDDTDAR